MSASKELIALFVLGVPWPRRVECMQLSSTRTGRPTVTTKGIMVHRLRGPSMRPYVTHTRYELSGTAHRSYLPFLYATRRETLRCLHTR